MPVLAPPPASPSIRLPRALPGRRAARLARPVAGALLALALGAAPAAVATPAASAAATAPALAVPGRAIEPFPVLQPQTRCLPTAKPGTRLLAAHLVARYPGTRSGGISRSCARGKASEHKEGRALDWRVRAGVPSEARAANDFLSWLFRPDAHGNSHANARRLGVMYVVWNRRIYGTYAPGWRPYTGASPHVDHMHISLSWPGAMGTTSFWSGWVAPPFSSPGASQQVLVLPANSRAGIHAPQPLLARGTYVLRVSGVYGYGRGLADGRCVQLRDGSWRAGSRRRAGEARLGLHVDGRRLAFAAAGQHAPAVRGCALGSHTYDAVFTQRRTGWLHVGLRDRRPADNAGSLVVRIVRVG